MVSGWVVVLAWLREGPGTGEEGASRMLWLCLVLFQKGWVFGDAGGSDVTSACDGRGLVAKMRRLCETWTGKPAEISFRSCLVVCITEFLWAWLSAATGTREW